MKNEKAAHARHGSSSDRSVMVTSRIEIVSAKAKKGETKQRAATSAEK